MVTDGTLPAGKIVEHSITTDQLNVSEIFADSAMVRELMAANIDVDTLMAREAMLGKVTTNMLSSDVGANLVITGGRTISMMADELDNVRSHFVVDATGVHVKATGSPA